MFAFYDRTGRISARPPNLCNNDNYSSPAGTNNWHRPLAGVEMLKTSGERRGYAPPPSPAASPRIVPRHLPVFGAHHRRPACTREGDPRMACFCKPATPDNLENTRSWRQPWAELSSPPWGSGAVSGCARWNFPILFESRFYPRFGMISPPEFRGP